MSTARDTPALRLAHRAWRRLHLHADEARQLAGRAAQRAKADGDALGAARAELVSAFHQLYFGQPEIAAGRLAAVARELDALGDRAGDILAHVGRARALWRGGQAQAALDLLMPLRDEGLHLLGPSQRAVLLNAIAGCHSAQGRSAEAFAYMFQALRDAGPKRGDGFDAVLHCNLSHELVQLGDADEALLAIERGLARCDGLTNPRLRGVLLINRVIALTELGRAAEALPDVREICATPTDASGRGQVALHYETLALAVLHAGEAEWGADLLERAAPLVRLSDERVEWALAQAKLAQLRGALPNALAALEAVRPLLNAEGDAATSLRVRCAHALLEAELHEALGQAPTALQALRRWQDWQQQRLRQASVARYQSAALQTELLDLQHRLDLNEAQRRATEREREQLARANAALQRKIEEVEALQAALRDQALRDALTGLANRRHLNDSLPATVALAIREAAPLSVVVIDLDHFKQVNDQFGHPAGDQLLAAFGALLRAHLRRSDQAFRYGGEEFCLLLPHTRARDAQATVQGLLAAWRAQRFVLDGEVELQGQSFSAGVADTEAAPPVAGALLRAADQLALAAKRAGRACVLVYDAVAPGA
ncbi:diguanylate cyclase [Inhella crocodyli]|uniref:diguanylate cyclase n=1 Tax=Inhella crocodyli TaxID=2499851 RepID=A0A3S2WMZ0_9BURK|nr:diguanylate cyclase [Inhella crocodyli]RVT83644.1 diguanylate cyclase [Inhella crocodyli]